MMTSCNNLLFRVCPTPVSVVAVASLLAIQAGCDSGLQSIDRRTDALLRETNARLGHETRTPERAWPDPPSMTDRNALRKQPGTTNPEADSLAFAVAEESRDVAERLRSMQEEDTESADAMSLDLPGALRQAQLTAREFLSAEEDYILAAIRLLIERHRWEPRLFATSTVGVAAGGTMARRARR